jgi:DNA polymerase-3 subunit alpha
VIKYHIDRPIVEYVQANERFLELDDNEHITLYNEIKNAVLQGIDDKILSKVFDEAPYMNDSSINSYLLWVLHLTKDKPTGLQKIKSPGSYCDIDLDFSQEKREKVFDYLAEKYGSTRVSHIATFGTMGAKAAIRNSARALSYPTELQNKVAKFISDEPKATIQGSIDASKEFQDMIKKSEQVQHIISVAKKLEGLPNSLSVHASAGIISDVATTDRVPMMVSAKKNDPITGISGSKVVSQFDMKDVENAGLLKYDILGLKTLDIINETVKIIKRNKDIDIDIESIDMNDPGIYKLLNAGHVTIVFQFDGTAAAYLPKIKPQNIDEISDLTSILRPGPMSMGMVERYAEAKFENKKYEYELKDQALIAKVWEICYRSYGLMIYQEQTIKCFVEIAGFNEIAADNARRAMGKKLPEEMAKLEGAFVEGGIKKGYNENDLKTLFKGIAGFAEYGFNASHAVCYSFITCQTAWLSHYYPLEFFTAAMTIDAGNTDDIRRYIKSAKERNIILSPPDINKSDSMFTIKDESIVFGLNAIKGVGPSTSKKIMARRPKKGYTSLGHFIRRNLDLINSKILESYTKAGCFKSFGYNKQSVLNSIQNILDFISVLKEYDKYNTFFDLCNISLDNFIDSCIMKDSQKEDTLSYEIDSLGLYISKHPMDVYDLKGMNDPSFVEYYENEDEFITIGCLSGIEVRKTKAKLNMCKFNIASSMYNLPCIIFPKAYSKYVNDPTIAEGRMVCVQGRIKISDTGRELIVNDIHDNIDRYLVRKVINKNEFPINSKLTFILG